MTIQHHFLGRIFRTAAATAFFFLTTLGPATSQDLTSQMHVFKSPSCGCCGAWVDIMRDAGFEVTVTNADELTSVKRQAGVPERLEACHTAIIDGYIVEGHVPAAAIRKLLRERPKVRGIAVPGMPYGSPGMGDDPNARYDVVTFGKDAGAGNPVFFSVGK